jgi:hypothetical protein
MKLVWHWYYLSLLLLPIILTLAFVFKDEHDVIYVPFAFSICSMILFLNFPILVILLHSRPIYYDDLIIKNYNDDEANRMYDDEFRRKYQRIFRLISTFTSSIMIGMATSLWFFRDGLFSHDSNQKHDVYYNFAIIGIISGIFSMYCRATMLIGNIIMYVLKWLRAREQEKMRKYQDTIALVELTTEGIISSENIQEQSIDLVQEDECMTDIFSGDARN